MDMQQMANRIKAIEGVESVNVWEKAGKRRVYIELPKLNGGKNWNGGRAVTLYLDSVEGLVCRQDWAGAKTRDHAAPIIEAIREVVRG